MSGRRCRRPAFQSRGGPSGVQLVGKARRRPAIAEARLGGEQKIQQGSREAIAARLHSCPFGWTLEPDAFLLLVAIGLLNGDRGGHLVPVSCTSDR